jgi:hypothetical protein
MHAALRLSADGTAGLHFAFLGYLVAGGFAAWRWPKSIAAHLLAAAWAALIVVTSLPCPLTSLQNRLREQAGQPPLGASFIDTYVRGSFFPADRAGLAQALVAVVVVASWLGFACVGRPDRRRSPRPGH